jgi:anthranilate synthase component 1
VESNFSFNPSLPEFEELSKSFNLIAVQARFSADSETPLSAYAKLSDQKPAFLFESVVGGEHVSRFSFVGFSPRKIISCGQEISTISEVGKPDRTIPTPDDPLKLVEDEISELKYYSPLKDGRFSGGAVGYLSYEYANRIEKTVPIPTEDELGLPLLHFMVSDLLLIFDHAQQSTRPHAKKYRKLETACWYLPVYLQPLFRKLMTPQYRLEISLKTSLKSVLMR